jgi:hypothetical protein
MEETIDVAAEEVVETSDQTTVQPRINEKELRKVVKKYKRYIKSNLREIRRVENES